VLVKSGRKWSDIDYRHLRVSAKARGEPVPDGWLRFKLSDTDYRRLSSTPDLAANFTVDRAAAQILGVRFLTCRQ
jgi:hypothetical protein